MPTEINSIYAIKFPKKPEFTQALISYMNYKGPEGWNWNEKGPECNLAFGDPIKKVEIIKRLRSLGLNMRECLKCYSPIPFDEFCSAGLSTEIKSIQPKQTGRFANLLRRLF